MTGGAGFVAAAPATKGEGKEEGREREKGRKKICPLISKAD